MNALDYVRDNRLRLWFINRCLPDNQHDITARDREFYFKKMMQDTIIQLSHNVKKGGYIILVLGDLRRGSRPANSAEIVKKSFLEQSDMVGFSLIDELYDSIPDLRRSRRDLRGTKGETVLVYKKGVFGESSS